MSSKWKRINGFSNMGDDDETVATRVLDDGNIEVAYCAYGGLKLLEVSHVDEISEFVKVEDCFSTLISECGDDWEVAFPVKVSGVNCIVAIDDNSFVELIPIDGNFDATQIVKPFVESSEEFDSDGCEELDEELLRLFNLV